MSAILKSLEKTSDGAYIVAKRYRSSESGALWFIMLFFSFGFFGFAIFNLVLDTFNANVIIFGSIGIFFVIAAIIALILYLTAPKIVITFKRGNFYFGKKLKCNPLKLNDLSIKRDKEYSRRYYGFNKYIYSESDNKDCTHGTLCFSIDGKQHQVSGIDNIDTVFETIGKIKKDYTLYISEKKRRELSERVQQAEEQRQVERLQQITSTELPGENEQHAQAEFVEPVAAVAQSEKTQLYEQNEQVEQIKKFEEFEQEAFEERLEQKELSEIAANIKLPDLPDLPDLSD